MNNFLMSLVLLLSISGCSYKVDVKAGFEKSDEMFLGVSEWPLEPITLHLWKENNIGYKCDGTFTKGNTSGGTINDGVFHLKCTDGQEINGDWYSPSGMNNLVAQGKNTNGQKFHMIAGTELSTHPNLLNTLKNKIYNKKDIPIKITQNRNISNLQKEVINKDILNHSKPKIKKYSNLNTTPIATSNIIESSIDGEFNGWEGETVVKLTNGQIWQQSSYHYEYNYGYMPDVLIYKSGIGYKMKVEGSDEDVEVKRLK